MDPFLVAVDLISGLVIVVALANLASTLALAVLRAVGFTPRQAVAVVATGGVALAILAVAVVPKSPNPNYRSVVIRNSCYGCDY